MTHTGASVTVQIGCFHIAIEVERKKMYNNIVMILRQYIQTFHYKEAWPIYVSLYSVVYYLNFTFSVRRSLLQHHLILLFGRHLLWEMLLGCVL